MNARVEGRDQTAQTIGRLLDLVVEARRRSPFYRDYLAGYSFTTLGEFEELPFTLKTDIEEQGEKFFYEDIIEKKEGAVDAEEGTQGDLEPWQRILAGILDAEDRLLILLPCEAPQETGWKVEQAAKAIGAETISLGPVGKRLSYNTVLSAVYDEQQVTAMAGFPSELRGLMKYSTKIHPWKIFLGGERGTDAVGKTLADVWECQRLQWYGIEEHCPIIGWTCPHLAGYHIWEERCYLEIIDPYTGQVQADGRWGEVVLTSWADETRPLIRYRTGDMSRILSETCDCGQTSRRLDRIRRSDL